MMPFNKETYLLWIDNEHSPDLNMAIDEELLFESQKTNTPFLRFYEWDRKAISIGYIQSYSQTAKEGYDLVRRPTGGGVVFHDIDLTYTITIPSGHKIELLPREESYHIFHKIIISALASIGLAGELIQTTKISKERHSMQCFSAPVKFDVAIKTDNTTSKVAGAAQRRTKHGILHQGSIVLPDMKSIRKTLIDSIIDSFKTWLGIAFIPFMPSHDFLDRAEILAQIKYSQSSWNKLR
ncbi:MAG: hypothetical protein WCR55_06960 [Lentisphaerota bacterium]